MPAAVNREKGFSMVEVLLAMMLLVIVVTALSGYHRALAARFTYLISIASSGTMPGISLSSQQMLSRRLAGQSGADNARRMCQHHGHTYFSSGAARSDNASALPVSQ